MYRLPRALRLRQQFPHPHERRLFAQAQQQVHIARHAPPRRPFSHAIRRSRPQTLYRPSGEPVRYQAVRFKKPAFFTWKRTATIILYGGVAYLYSNLLTRYLGLEVQIGDAEDAEHEKEEEGEGEETEEGPPFYAAEDSTFIPMTWATKLPRTYYKGSDPEWQAFVQVARDKPRHKKIQNELVQIVYTGAKQHPAIARQLGKEPKVGKYWLDISFPDAPPQEYERSGIELGDGYVAWSQQKISAATQWRITRALWPQAAAESVWVTGKMLVGVQWRRMKQMLGWEGRDPFSPEERYRHAIEMVEKRGQGQERKSAEAAAVDVVTRSSTPQSSTSNDATPKLPWPLPWPLPFSTSSSTSTSSSESSLLGSSPSQDASPTLPLALHTFNRTLSKTWNPKKSEPPRGSFVVQGLVEVRGSRGRMLFDVQSCYDPSKAKFVVVHAAVRNWKRWEQAPRGGA